MAAAVRPMAALAMVAVGWVVVPAAAVGAALIAPPVVAVAGPLVVRAAKGGEAARVVVELEITFNAFISQPLDKPYCETHV